jgi:hypothetical protein
MKSWRRIRTKGVAFSLPPSFRNLSPKAGSGAGPEEWSDGKARLAVEYGITSQLRKRKKGVSICALRIGGRKAFVRTEVAGGAHWALAWFPELHPAGRDGGTAPSDPELLFSAQGRSAGDQRMFLAAFRSVRTAP